MGNGYYHSLSPHKMFITCGNCQLVCHPEKEERQRRLNLLKKAGVVVQNENGSVEAIPPEDALRKMEAMEPQRRAMYEDIG